MNFNQLRDKAYQIAVAHGWHEKDLPHDHWIMLIISELSEAIQAERKARYAQVDSYKSSISIMDTIRDYWSTSEGQKLLQKIFYEKFMKDSFEDELADVVIRTLDFAGLREIDLSPLQENEKDGYCIEDPSLMNDFAGQRPFTRVAFELTDTLTSCFDDWQELRPDRLIRFLNDVMYYCRFKRIDIEFFVQEKMTFNESRCFKHGKLY